MCPCKCKSVKAELKELIRNRSQVLNLDTEHVYFMNPYLYIPAVISILIGLYIYRGDREGRDCKGEVELQGIGKFKGVTWFLFLIIGIAIMVYGSV